MGRIINARNRRVAIRAGLGAAVLAGGFIALQQTAVLAPSEPSVGNSTNARPRRAAEDVRMSFAPTSPREATPEGGGRHAPKSEFAGELPGDEQEILHEEMIPEDPEGSAQLVERMNQVLRSLEDSGTNGSQSGDVGWFPEDRDAMIVEGVQILAQLRAELGPTDPYFLDAERRLERVE